MSEVLEHVDASAYPKPTYTEPPTLFKLLSLTDVFARPEPPWTIAGVIPGSGVSVIFGKPNAGKTFIALDMALHVAYGVEWFGRRTEQHPVVYVGLEGTGGIGKRMQGLVLERFQDLKEKRPGLVCDIANFPMRFVLDEEFRFTVDDDSYAKRLIASIQGLNLEKPMIIIDTLAMALEGNESDNQVMSAAARQANQLRAQTGGPVVLIHHPSKGNAEDLRGGSALNGAIDTSVLVSGDKGKEKTWRMAKTRDDSTELQYAFDLVPVEIPCRLPGEDKVTTCVVKERPDRKTEATARKEPTGANQKKLLGIMRAQFPNGCTEPQLIEAWRHTLPTEAVKRAKTQVAATLTKLEPDYVKRCPDGQLVAT